MYKANLTFKDSQGEYTRTIEHDDHNLFQAMILGTIKGSLSCKATLISIEM